jgi:hypothetical protein
MNRVCGRAPWMRRVEPETLTMEVLKMKRTVKPLSRAAGVLLSTALCVAPAAATTTIVEVSGQITSAEALTFAVLNGNLLSSNPEPGDLPLGYTGVLTIDDTAQTALFEFEGSFTSPTRSYVFDVATGDIFAGITTNTATDIVINDAFADFDFDLALDLTTGTGNFSWFDAGAVPSSPPGDRSAVATITSAVVIPEPASALLLGCATLMIGLRRNTRR